MKKAADKKFPLRSRTPEAWAKMALKEPLALLCDHAFLEKKATLNAMELLNRWPDKAVAANWSSTLAGVARDEAAHLNTVTRLLKKKGGFLDRIHKNPYANDLHKLVRMGRANLELVDRLLISALIEIRSCERFEVLARCCRDPEMAKLYEGLWSSEFGHYVVFLKLAGYVVPPAELEKRWDEMLEAEAKILAAQPPGPRMHSGTA